MSRLIDVITAADGGRDQPLEPLIRDLSADELAAEIEALERFRGATSNLYEKVRALFFLYAIHRFALAGQEGATAGEASAKIPFDGHQLLLQRRVEEAIARFRAAADSKRAGVPTGGALATALAVAYRGLGFQTLADQVRRSVRSVRGNQWMFRCGHPLDLPLRLRPELRSGAVLRERTPVRMDLTHCGWSDIFFLGMDFPAGAQVLNVSIDLAVRHADGTPGAAPEPPVETFLRAIDEPVLRLTSIDLGATSDLVEVAELFDFARDHLGLLKAGVLASGLVPPGLEGSGATFEQLFARLIGPGRGLEIVTQVRGIPKGSRLAVSTTLLGSLIALCMRATGQTKSLTGMLDEEERRLCAARAILGEWLGGSGGGWQDSGGLWPGIKRIHGEEARAGDPEFGVSRGRLLPRHELLGRDGPGAVPQSARDALQRSLVLVHGGMAQNVGPILEMVTEKYLLRSEPEWTARLETGAILQRLLAALKAGDVAELARATTDNFFGPLTTIIPFATNHFTETVITRVKERFGADFQGFWMLGGMSGGGMGFIFTPETQPAAKVALQEILGATKRELADALPFAMEPVVYDFAINERGTWAELFGAGAIELPKLPARATAATENAGAKPTGAAASEKELSLERLLAEQGFDRAMHEQIRRDLQAGRIGLAQNRLPAHTRIEDVGARDVLRPERAGDGERRERRERGLSLLRNGEAAIVTLAAGSGSRWTQGAGTVKALFPFVKFGGRHRSFLELHLAKSRRIARLAGTKLHHVVTTSHATHAPIEQALKLLSEPSTDAAADRVVAHLSPGRAVGLRLVPMERDLRFAWEETSHQRLDRQAQKVRESAHAALIGWAKSAGEGSDYTDNVAAQCLHPVGHWYEIPNLLKNGVLARLLREQPRLRTLLLHNVDTVGADLDPELLALHRDDVARGHVLTFEMIERQLEDRGGGLARIASEGGRPRLIEGLALPHEEDEFGLSYYNTMTTWVDVDGLLRVFGLTRADLLAVDATPETAAKVAAAVRRLAAQLPTYVTLKDVKKRWGHGHEDVFPIAQFEKLWSDMSALPDCPSSYLIVPRPRGQQLKEPAQLDPWLRDGSAQYVESRCDWS